MVINIQILALLAIAFCFTPQSRASPLALSEDATDGEKTDREFEDAFEAAVEEEVAREFQFKNAYETRDFDDDEEEARTLQGQSSYLDAVQEEDVGKETDRQFEDAFDKALKEEVARNFEDEEMDVGEDDQVEDQEIISSEFDITPSNFSQSEDDQLEDQEIISSEFDITPSNFSQSEDDQLEDQELISAEFDITPSNFSQSEDDQLEDQELISAEFDITSSKSSKDEQQSEYERQIPTDNNITPPEKEVSDVKPRTTEPLRLSKLIIRPMLTKRCQGKNNFSLKHCAKYLSCGTTMFRGAIRTCESGQLFDAVLKICNDSDKVDCKIRT